MTMRDVSVTILKPDGRPYPGVQVQVVDYSSGALASLYKEDGYTAASNPMITDSNGYASAMAPIGSYALVAVSGSARRVVKRIVISDKVEQSLSTHTHVMNDITDAGALATKNQVDTADIADAAVTSTKIADLAVISTKIADLAVISAKIADEAITEAKLANLSIASGKLQDLAIITAKLANQAVTTAKLADSAVTSSKIGTGAVTEAGLSDLSISTAKLQDAAIETAKLADASLTSIGALTPVDGKLIKYTGATTAALITISSFIETLLDDADDSTARNTLGVLGAPSPLTENVIPKARADGDLQDSQFADNGSQVTLWGRSLRFIGTGQPYLLEALNSDSSDYVHLIRRGASDDAVEVGIYGASEVKLGAKLTSANGWIETSRHYIDVNFSPTVIAASGEAKAPDLVNFASTTIKVAAFDANTEEEVSHDIEIPHAYMAGEDIIPHLHWFPTTTDTGTVRFGLEYIIVSADGTVSTSTTIYAEDSGDGTANKRQDLSFAAIDGTSVNEGDQLYFRFFRDTDHANDTYTDDAIVGTAGFHIPVNSIGSDGEFYKS